jgi:orotidine-5'-phosphate decarboxylase
VIGRPITAAEDPAAAADAIAAEMEKALTSHQAQAQKP